VEFLRRALIHTKRFGEGRWKFSWLMMDARTYGGRKNRAVRGCAAVVSDDKRVDEKLG
jgi:hypothetical protein